jgi:RNA-directed DNA polymerase
LKDTKKYVESRQLQKEGYLQEVRVELGGNAGVPSISSTNHDKLMRLLSETIKDSRVLSLIRKYLQSGVMVNGVVMRTKEGTPQGGVISPLCSNIMLNELDHELESRGIRFVRYADDMLLFAKTKRSANRMLEHILPFIERNLLLKVNKDKTTVAYIGRVKFLGYGFYPSKDGIKLRVHAKSIAKMKAKVKEITARSSGIGYDLLKLRLKQFITGWVNYFKLANMKTLLKETDSWLRRRLRMFIWKRWKRIRTRYAMLKKCGLDHRTAIKFANTRKGYWRIANSHIMTLSVTDNRLRKAGYTFFWDICNAVKV